MIWNLKLLETFKYFMPGYQLSFLTEEHTFPLLGLGSQKVENRISDVQCYIFSFHNFLCSEA
jgi:hypothetical protein